MCDPILETLVTIQTHLVLPVVKMRPHPAPLPLLCIGAVFPLPRNFLRSSIQIPNKANQLNSPYQYVYSIQFKARRPKLY